MADILAIKIGEIQASITGLAKRLNTLEAQDKVGNFTAGSILFAGSDGSITQDNSGLFWDDSNNRLGIGTASPGTPLEVAGVIRTTSVFQSLVEMAAANTVTSAIELYRRTTGTAATGLGSQIVFYGESTTGANQPQAVIMGVWSNTPDSSRRSDLRLYAFDTTSREFFRGGSTGSAAGIGFFGGAVAAKQTVTGSKGGNAALASLLTALANYGLITDSSS